MADWYTLKTRLIGLLSFIWIAVFVLGACVPATVVPTDTVNPESIYTSAAHTFQAQLTLSSASTQTVQPVVPSATLPPPATPSPTNTFTPFPSPTYTSLPPTATIPPVPCDWAELMGNLSGSDNSLFTPGASFTETWRLKNIGSCTWTMGYSLVFIGGNLLGVGSSVSLPESVAPGETVNISVELTAPGAPGIYTGNWMLRNASGQLFGTDFNAQGSFWTQIQVVDSSRSDYVTYDLAANYCSAEWYSDAGILNCPGSRYDPQGSVILLEKPDIETGLQNELGLWTRPNTAEDGWVSGYYPAYPIQNGDHFFAEIGCLNGSRRCDVLFQLDYQVNDGQVENLGEWTEVYDGEMTKIDVDLSGLAGNSVQLILTVFDSSRHGSADAVWLAPRVENPIPASDLVYTWHAESGTPMASCKELKVFRSGYHFGEARAFYCKGGWQELGAVRLSDAQLNQVNSLSNRLKTFEAEIYSASTDEPENTWISFTGRGNGDASHADILALQSLAQQLYSAISR